jgi:hypothetical protein
MSQMFLNVVSTFKGDGLAAATRQLGAFGKASDGLGGTLGKVGAALASFGIAAKTVQFGRDSIDSARDLERNLFSVKTVFDEFSPAIEKFTVNAENLGLAQKDAAKASVFLGSVLKQSGFSMDFVTTETQKLVSLGVDLAATYGYDVQEALLGMTALFRGEYDPIEKFGVAMKQSEINSELAARGLDKLEGSARRNAEQTIRLELLYQRAADATGAFTAQSGNLYVEQKKLTAQWENLQAQVGTQLLPVMGELVAALKPLVDELTPRFAQAISDAIPVLQGFNQILKDASDETTTAGQTFAFFGDTLNNIFGLISRNFGVLVQLTALFMGVRLAITLVTAALATTPMGWAIIGFGALAGAMLLVADAASKVEDRVYKANVEMLKADAVKQAIAPYRVYEGILGDISNSTFKVSEETMRLAKEVDRADKAKLTNLKNQIDGVQISAAYAANELRRMSMQAGIQVPAAPGGGVAGGGSIAGGGGGSSQPAAAAVGALEQLNKTQTLSVKKAAAQNKLLGLNLRQGVVNQILSMTKPVKAANDIFKDLTKKNGELTKKGAREVAKLNAQYDAGIEQVNQRNAEAAAAAAAAAEEARRQAEELRRAEEARIEGLNQLYANFLDTIKGTFAGIRNAIQGAFDITGLGGSTNAILRNMDKLLTRLKSFSSNVRQLATMGLDPALLQQIITAGPMAGARIASALVSGGAGALSAINAGYGQIGNLASEIATTGVNSLFDTQRQQSVYNITVTGGVGSGSTIGKAIVDAIKDYERTSGAVWQGA